MKYNDYELLDLIYDNDEVAYDIMLNKYKPLIYIKLRSIITIYKIIISTDLLLMIL